MAKVWPVPLADINRQKIHYTDSGRGPAVIATHATLVDLVSLEPLTSKIVEAGYRVVAFDLRGHGETVYDQQPYDYTDVAADVVGLADHLGIDRFIFLGEGQGAVVAMRTALFAPERVRGLVLIGATADAALEGENAALSAAMDVWCTEGPLAEMFESIAQMATGGEQDAADLMDRWKASAWRDYRPAADALASRGRFVEELPRITCPALVLHATQDVFIPMFLGKEVADNLGGPTTFELVETRFHAITVAFNPCVAEAVCAWLPGVADSAQ